MKILLFVCLLINWLCAFIVFSDKPHRKKIQKTYKKDFVYFEYDGGKLLMAITNTLMMVQTGNPTGLCEVRSCEDYL